MEVNTVLRETSINHIGVQSEEKVQLINQAFFGSVFFFCCFLGEGGKSVSNQRDWQCMQKKTWSNLLSNGLKNRPYLFHSACLDTNKNSVFYICFPAWFIAILPSSNQFVCFSSRSCCSNPPPPSASVWGKAVLHPADQLRDCRTGGLRMMGWFPWLHLVPVTQLNKDFPVSEDTDTSSWIHGTIWVTNPPFSVGKSLLSAMCGRVTLTIGSVPLVSKA